MGLGELCSGVSCLCGATDAKTRHSRLVVSGAQVNQYQPLVHPTSRFLKRMSVRHQVKSGAPHITDGGLRMGIVIERVGLRDVSASNFL